MMKTGCFQTTTHPVLEMKRLIPPALTTDKCTVPNSPDTLAENGGDRCAGRHSVYPYTPSHVYMAVAKSSVVQQKTLRQPQIWTQAAYRHRIGWVLGTVELCPQHPPMRVVRGPGPSCSPRNVRRCENHAHVLFPTGNRSRDMNRRILPIRRVLLSKALHLSGRGNSSSLLRATSALCKAVEKKFVIPYIGVSPLTQTTPCR